MTGVPGIEPQTSRSQVQHLTTQPRTSPTYDIDYLARLQLV